jgi:hypothetical protein
MPRRLPLDRDPEPPAKPTRGATINHGLAASIQVMEGEIAWFETLDDETIERIAAAAPVDSPEYDYANAELARRRFLRRTQPRQCGWSHG